MLKIKTFVPNKFLALDFHGRFHIRVNLVYILKVSNFEKCGGHQPFSKEKYTLTFQIKEKEKRTNLHC